MAQVFIKSGAKLFVAPVGEGMPDENTAANDAPGGNWTYLGFTKEGATFTFSREEEVLTVDEVSAGVDSSITESMASISATLVDMDAANIAMLSGGTLTATVAGAGQVAFNHVVVKAAANLCAGSAKWAVLLEAVYCDDDGNELPYRIYLPRAGLNADGEMAFSRKSGEFTGLPFVATSMPLVAADGTVGNLWELQQVTAPATS